MAIQISRVYTVREITMNSVEFFCALIGLNNTLDIKYIYIGPPDMNENFKIIFKKDDDSLHTEQVFHDIEIVRPPPDYSDKNTKNSSYKNIVEEKKKKML